MPTISVSSAVAIDSSNATYAALFPRVDSNVKWLAMSNVAQQLGRQMAGKRSKQQSAMDRDPVEQGGAYM
jgi:hypothetical protein